MFAEVHDRYFSDIYRYVAGRLGATAAEDVTADTFLIAFRKRDAFDPARGDLRPWSYGIATKQVAPENWLKPGWRVTYSARQDAGWTNTEPVLPKTNCTDSSAPPE